METQQIKKQFWLIAIILFTFSSINAWAEKQNNTKKKEVSKSFNVSTNDLLKIDNKYGNITITYWDKNEVSIRVVVESTARSEKKAAESIDRVEVSMQKSGSTVSASTSLKSSFGSNNTESLTIDYYIHMPYKLTSNLYQKYGNINLPEKNIGKCVLEVKYGNIKGGNFTAPLEISSAYSNISLGDVEKVNLDLAYCGKVTFNNGNDVNIDSKYSNLDIRNVKKLRIDGKYGNLKVQNADIVSMDIKYSEASFERIKEELIVESLRYSTATVNELASGFSNVNVNAHYGKLNLSVSNNTSFNIEAINMKDGKVDVSGLNITNSTIDNKTNYNYQIKGGNSKCKIHFNGNSYSNLKIKSL